MAKLGSDARIFVWVGDVYHNGGIRVEGWRELTDDIVSFTIEEGSMIPIMKKRFAIRKVHAPHVYIKDVQKAILKTNPSFVKTVEFNTLFYAVVVECDNKPEALRGGLIEWIELKEL